MGGRAGPELDCWSGTTSQGSKHPTRLLTAKGSLDALVPHALGQRRLRLLCLPSQVWSITYHSWLTFVLLLWACLIWMVRNRHQVAMLCSPFILLYGIALCSLQYVWGMDLEEELPTKVGFMPLEQLGLVRPLYPCLYLGAKVETTKEPALSPPGCVSFLLACLWGSAGLSWEGNSTNDQPQLAI